MDFFNFYNNYFKSYKIVKKKKDYMLNVRSFVFFFN